MSEYLKTNFAKKIRGANERFISAFGKNYKMEVTDE